MAVRVYDFMDFRAFLKAFYEEKNQQDKKYSHRYFASKAGVNSSGFFASVLSGKRNLTSTMTLRFSKALGLSPKEEEFFEVLVSFNQARTYPEKEHFYEKLLSLQPVKISVLGKFQHEFYSKWYYSAIRELLNFYYFKDDYSALAKRLRPSIRPEQAKRAITVLEKLGLIKKNGKGTYKQTTAIISSGNEEKSVNITRFQLETSELAKQAVVQAGDDTRDFSTLTLTLSDDSYKQARLEIAGLRRRLLAIAERDKKVNSVYHLNFQLFPMTK